MEEVAAEMVVMEEYSFRHGETVPFAAFFFFSPSFLLPLIFSVWPRLCRAQVSQSSSEGQTDFTVVGKRVMCLIGAGLLHS